jgi:hypothetical protein
VREIGGRPTPGALFKLVRVDKTFLAGRFGASVLMLKQHEGDWEFFKQLGEAIGQKPVDEPAYLFKAKLICAYFWETEFVEMSFGKIVEALKRADVLGAGVDPRSFAKMLNRVGLRRSRYNRKVRQ